jgi:cell division transport system ATP-binding protein
MGRPKGFIPMIRLQDVSKVYDGGVVAVKDASLEIAKGEFVFLVGPSGSGKSTLIRLMMREEKPTDGELWVAGKHASDLPSWKVPHLRRSIGTVFQDFKLLPNKTVYENVSFAMEVTGRPRQVSRTQVPQVLKLVGLSAKADRYPRQLSGGEQQRVSLARAFVNRPLILLADEPTGNLDPGTSVGIMRILDRINRTGTTVVMATHDHAIVDAMRRRVVQLDQGFIVRDQNRGVYDRTAEGRIARQMSSASAAAAAAAAATAAPATAAPESAPPPPEPLVPADDAVAELDDFTPESVPDAAAHEAVVEEAVVAGAADPAGVATDVGELETFDAAEDDVPEAAEALEAVAEDADDGAELGDDGATDTPDSDLPSDEGDDN